VLAQQQHKNRQLLIFGKALNQHSNILFHAPMFLMRSLPV